MISAKEALAISKRPVTVEDYIRKAAENGEYYVVLPFKISAGEKEELISNGYEIRQQKSKGDYRISDEINYVTYIYWHNPK